jgi:hypothetical protein
LQPLQFLQRRRSRFSELRLISPIVPRARFLHCAGGMNPDRFVRENTIIGIFNYCTRRCEQCAFTERCTLYLSERDYERRHPRATFEDRMKDSFAETFRLLEAWCKREGIDFERIIQDADSDETDAASERAAEAVREDPLQKFATGYMRAALNVMDAMSTARSVRRWGPEVEAALDTIGWNASMLSAKVHRALHGFAERTTYRDDDPIQNDWNGSAKVARILVDESRRAWRIVLTIGEAPEDSPLSELIALLDRIDAMLAERFPDALRFIRPGFDAPPPTVALA